jgi:transcriptional regulator with XRE-family HTH domain
MSKRKDLDQSARDLLLARRGDWPRIAQATGISYGWITKFAQNVGGDPSYKRLRQLHDYLAGSVSRD